MPRDREADLTGGRGKTGEAITNVGDRARGCGLEILDESREFYAGMRASR
jgi:hypothetical protein